MLQYWRCDSASWDCSVQTLSVHIVGSSFIVNGSPSGHMRYPLSSPHSAASHITMSVLLWVISTCIILTGSESAWLDFLFWPCNPAKLWHQSEAGSGCSSWLVHWLTAPGKEGRWQQRGRSSCCTASTSYGVIHTFEKCFDAVNQRESTHEIRWGVTILEFYLQSLRGPWKLTILLLVIASWSANAIKNPIHTGLST